MKIKMFVLCVFSAMAGKAQMSPMPPMPEQAHADHGDTHKTKDPPHGGTVVDAGKRHLEIVFDPFAGEEKLTVYVLSSGYKLKHPSDGEATVQLNYKNEVKLAKEMIKLEDRFVCNIENLTIPFNAIITVKTGGKNYVATYFYKGLGK